MSSLKAPHKEREQPSKRFDALSLFLAVCMGTLVLMYALDIRQAEQLDAHDTLAAQLPLGPLQGPCTAMAVGAHAHEALIVCATISRQELKPRLAELWDTTAPPDWLQRVALRDDTGTMICTRTLDACTDAPRPTRDAMKASRRRPPRQ